MRLSLINTLAACALTSGVTAQGDDDLDDWRAFRVYSILSEKSFFMLPSVLSANFLSSLSQPCLATLNNITAADSPFATCSNFTGLRSGESSFLGSLSR